MSVESVKDEATELYKEGKWAPPFARARRFREAARASCAPPLTRARLRVNRGIFGAENAVLKGMRRLSPNTLRLSG